GRGRVREEAGTRDYEDRDEHGRSRGEGERYAVAPDRAVVGEPVARAEPTDDPGHGEKAPAPAALMVMPLSPGHARSQGKRQHPAQSIPCEHGRSPPPRPSHRPLLELLRGCGHKSNWPLERRCGPRRDATGRTGSASAPAISKRHPV